MTFELPTATAGPPFGGVPGSALRLPFSPEAEHPRAKPITTKANTGDAANWFVVIRKSRTIPPLMAAATTPRNHHAIRKP